MDGVLEILSLLGGVLYGSFRIIGRKSLSDEIPHWWWVCIFIASTQRFIWFWLLHAGVKPGPTHRGFLLLLLFFIIDWWTWNAGLCIYQANAVVLGFTHILNFQIWQRVSFFSLKKAISESLDDRCVTVFLPTLFILNLLEQIWVFYMYACLYTTYVCSPSSYKITSEPHKWVNG